MILMVLIANETGNPLYSKILGPKVIDETLVMAFFSALKMFGKYFMQDNSELETIRIGNALLDFSDVDFEEIGSVDVIMVSEGFDPSTSHALVETITEQFSIYLDEVRKQDPLLIELIKKGQYPDLKPFDAVLEQINNSCQTPENLHLDIQLVIPTELSNTIKKMFKMKPQLAEAYENNERTLLEQIIQESTILHLDKDLKQYFKKFK